MPTETDSPGFTTLGKIFLRVASFQTKESRTAEWDSLVMESGKLLKIIRRRSSDAMTDDAALSLAKVIHASNSLGMSAAMRNSTAIQSEKARAGKKHKTDRRWKSVRCAIVWVCRKQRLMLTASDAFAESIRADVIESAKRFGLTDIRAGTSARSIERHIGVLLKDHRLLSAILGAPLDVETARTADSEAVSVLEDPAILRRAPAEWLAEYENIAGARRLRNGFNGLTSMSRQMQSEPATIDGFPAQSDPALPQPLVGSRLLALSLYGRIELLSTEKTR